MVEVRENEVLLNIGFKSEGVIPLDEFGGTVTLDLRTTLVLGRAGRRTDAR